MIEDEIDGMAPSQGKLSTVVAHATSTCNETGSEEYDDIAYDEVDVRGALELFDEFPWKEHRDEVATRIRLNVAWFYPRLTFQIDSFYILITATEKEYLFDVRVCLPAARKFLGLFRTTEWYEFERARKSLVPELIALFFDPSDDRRRAAIASLAKNHDGPSRGGRRT